MDKLAKRAGVTALVVVVAAGSAFALGMARYASSLETETERAADTPPLAAALRLPVPAPPTLVVPLVEAPRQLAAAPLQALPPPPKQASPKKLALRSTALPETRDLTPEPVADDMLDLDFGGNEREAKLSDRGAHAFGARQLGGAEEQHRTVIPGERVTFETDLAKPGDY